MSAERVALFGHTGAKCGGWLLTMVQKLAGKKHRGLRFTLCIWIPWPGHEQICITI